MATFKLTTLLYALAVLMAALAPPAANASELFALGGVMRSSDPQDASYSWQLEYRQDLYRHLAAGFSYLNEGHVDGHRRDGYTAQLWLRSELFAKRLTVAAALGPYFYLDTTRAFNAKGFTNDHGTKAMLSFAAAWHLQNDLIFELRTNWTTGGQNFDSASVLGGIGYHFDPNLEPRPGKEFEHEAQNEITAFLGQTIQNSFESETAMSGEIEYRHRFLRHLDWTIGNIYEGNDKLARRDGLVSQVWANQDLLEGLISVGVGVGPYLSLSHYHNALVDDDQRFACMVTLGGSYRFTPHWGLRVSWNRMVTGNDLDSDIIMGGLGYRF
ncbi:hypothetical protein [Geomonas sp.]|uniref:outer membrane protein n=1 Tax=Geomonas sp. TaxID=2651584 RepID=UPI002B45BE9A|nr:hypothetical protein [Geomonas sp.]HJV36321.1 hypothetical protein [Geomonas sp.]